MRRLFERALGLGGGRRRGGRRHRPPGPAVNGVPATKFRAGQQPLTTDAFAQGSGESLWCSAVAYFSSGQPIVLQAEEARTARLAVRALQRQLDWLVASRELAPESNAAKWPTNDELQEKALYALACGRSYAVTASDELATYVVTAHSGGGRSLRPPSRERCRAT